MSAKDWKRTSKDHPCQVCGHIKGWCKYTADGAYLCQKMMGAEVPGWRIVIPKAGHPKMGHIYRRDGDATPGAPQMSAAERELEEKEAAAKTRAEVAAAQTWWRDGVENAPDAIEYFRRRGVNVEDMPGGRLPPSIRCTPVRTDSVKLRDENRFVKSTGPVIVGECVNGAGITRAVQRIFIAEDGAGKRPDSEEGPLCVKMAKGPLLGTAVRLEARGGGYPGGILVLCEGLETAAAIFAGMNREQWPIAVWACISTAGLINIELPEEAKEGGSIKRMIIAGDHDEVDPRAGWRPGEHYAWMAGRRLKGMCPHLAVQVALPRGGGDGGVPELVGVDGEVVGGEKGVDWDDVHRELGAARMRAGILDGVEVERVPRRASPSPLGEDGSGGDDGDGVGGGDPPGDDGAPWPEPKDDRKFIPAEPLQRARMAIEALYWPDRCEPGRGRKLRRWDEQWWRHDGVSYQPMSEEAIKADLRPWLSPFWTRTSRGKVVRLNAPEKTLNELVSNMQTDTLHAASAMPAWLVEEFDGEGMDLPRPRPFTRVHLPASAKAAGLPDPLELIVFRNGIFDIRAWLDRRVEFRPHSELLFTATALPFECPVDEFRRVADDDEALQEAIERLCPVWLEFLASTSGLTSARSEDEERDAKAWEELLAQMFGYCLTAWTKYEVVFVLSGASRAGKGVIARALTALVGQQNVASSDMNLLVDKFHLHGLIGKTVMLMPDADLGKSTDVVRAGETLKKISGGDDVYVDRKHQDALAAVRLFCKPVIMCNRMPSLPDPSGAIANRFRVLPFEESAAGKEDARYKDQDVIDRESVGRMLWALRGLRHLVKMGKFVQPLRGAELLQEYRDHSDPLRQFVEDCLTQVIEVGDDQVERKVRCDEGFEFTNDLYEVWKRWCTVVGRERPNAQAWFGQQLRAACPWIRRKQRPDASGKRKWGYVGIAISNRMDTQTTMYS
jgi:P4 family phage/plasmid primase-like protien